MRNNISRTNQALALLWVALSVGAIFLMAAFWHSGDLLETDLMTLFPAIEKDAEVEQALHRVRQDVDRQLVFLVGHADLSVAKVSAARLATALDQHAKIERVLSRMSGEDEKQWWQLYSPYASQLLTDDVRSMLRRGEGQGWVQRVMAQVYSPFAAVGAEELRTDPMLLTRNFFMNLKQYQGKLQHDDGWLVSEPVNDIHYVLVTAELAINPYTLVGSNTLITELSRVLKGLENDQPGLRFLQHGTLFYAAHGIKQAQTEISTIGVGSVLGVILLLGAVFRRFQPFLLGALSVTCGLLFASVTTILVLGNIHIFTLVIGASLIGVSIDYSFHYLCEWLSDQEGWQPLVALRRILPAICMGFLTSVMAYLVLLLTPFPGLKQLAVFSSAGLLAAFLTVVLLYPLLLKSPSVRPMPLAGVLNFWLGLVRTPAVSRALRLSLLVLALFAIPQLKTNDDIRQLQAAPEGLRRQGQEIAAIVGSTMSQQMLVVRGRDDEEVLQKLENVSSALNNAVSEGALESFRSLSVLVPSRQQQENDFVLIRDQLMIPLLPVLHQQLKLGTPEPGDSGDKEFTPLTVDSWLRSSVSRGWRMMWLGGVGEHQGAIIPLDGVADAAAIESLAAKYDGVDYVSPADELSELFGFYRVKITVLLAASYAAILLLLCWRYGLSRAIRILDAPLFAGAASLAVLSLLGLPLNLFGILGLVLVLGIGIDYTLFMAECRETPVSTLLAVSLSACTTVLSFGLLSLSQTAAIQTFGLVVLVGILVAFVLAPSAYDRSLQDVRKRGEGHHDLP